MAELWVVIPIVLFAFLAGFCFARTTQEDADVTVAKFEAARDRVAYLEDYYGLDAHTVVMGGKEFGVEAPEHVPFDPRWDFTTKPAAGRQVRRG